MRKDLAWKTSLLLLLLVAGSTGASAIQTVSSGSVSFTLERPQIVLNEPIYARLSVKSHAAEQITFDLGLNHESGLSLVIDAPGGKTIRPPKRTGTDDLRTNPAFAVGAPGVVTLAPGETYSQRVLLNKWYDFGESGRYQITIQIDAVVRTKSGRVATLAGPPLMGLTVGERDAGYLRRLAGSLADIAVSSVGLNVREQAATELSYIRDPIAVPSLIRVLENGMWTEEYAIVGLRRIGSADAVDALIKSMGTTTDARLAALTKIALQRIENETTDRGMKDRIRAAISH